MINQEAAVFWICYPKPPQHAELTHKVKPAPLTYTSLQVHWKKLAYACFDIHLKQILSPWKWRQHNSPKHGKSTLYQAFENKCSENLQTYTD
jgi:hypothetical protein